MTPSAPLSRPASFRERKLRIWYYDTVAPLPVETPPRVLGKRTRGEQRLASSSPAISTVAPAPQASSVGRKKEEWAEEGQVCSNCGYESSHVKYWCAGLQPGIICNTCGEHFRKHRVARPAPGTPSVSASVDAPASAATSAPAAAPNHPSGWNPVKAPPPPLAAPSSTTIPTAAAAAANDAEFEHDPHDLITLAEEPRLIHHLDRTLYSLNECGEDAQVWIELKAHLDAEFSSLPVAAGVPLAKRVERDDGLKRIEKLMMARPQGITRHPFRLRELAEELIGTQYLIHRCHFYQQNPGYWGPLLSGEPNDPNKEGMKALYVEGQPGVLTGEAGNALGMPDYDPNPFLVERDDEGAQPDLMPRDDCDDRQ